jgi:hypothetical protein
MQHNADSPDFADATSKTPDVASPNLDVALSATQRNSERNIALIH